MIKPMSEEQPQKQNPFEMTTEEMDKKFDLIINFFKQKAELNRARFMMGTLKQVGNPDGILSRMVDYELLYSGTDMDGKIYKLTKFGYEVLRAGGWIQYHKDQVAHEKLIRDQIKSTIDTNKFQKTVLFSTIALSLGTFFLSLGTFFSNERLLGIEQQRLDREKAQVIAPAVNPNVNLTLKRDTIVIIQPSKAKR